MNHNNNKNNKNNNCEYTRISTTSTDHITTTNDGTTIETSSQKQQGAATVVTTSSTTPFSNDDNSTATVNHVVVPTSRTITEKITDKFIAVIWVVVASVVFHYTNSAHVYLLIDNNNNQPTANVLLMQIVMIGLGINTVLFLYLLIYLPYVKGLHDSTAWDVYCPRVIPCMTLIGLSVLIILIRATYPIWGFLAPFIIGIEAMGLLFSFHFIPVGFL